MSTSSSTLLPYTPVTPSAPQIVELADFGSVSACHDDPLYYEYDPYAEGRDDSKYSDDDGGIRMYEVDLNDRPRPPPPLPPRPSWSPSTTLREQSNTSSSSSSSPASSNPATPRHSLSSSASASPYRYVHSTEANKPPTVLDPQQLTARTLTTRAEPLWFRIHNTVLRLHPVSFDDLPEMTLWLNRAKLSSDRLIHDTHGRLLCNLKWLMSDSGAERFEGMRDRLYVGIQQREGKCTKKGGTQCNMEYFFYGDEIGILYTEWRVGAKKNVRWSDGAASDKGWCCVIL